MHNLQFNITKIFAQQQERREKSLAVAKKLLESENIKDRYFGRMMASGRRTQDEVRKEWKKMDGYDRAVALEQHEQYEFRQYERANSFAFRNGKWVNIYTGEEKREGNSISSTSSLPDTELELPLKEIQMSDDTEHVSNQIELNQTINTSSDDELSQDSYDSDSGSEIMADPTVDIIPLLDDSNALYPTVTTENGTVHQFYDTDDFTAYVERLEASNSHYKMNLQPIAILAGGARGRNKGGGKGRGKGRKGGGRRKKKRGGPLISMKGDQRGVIAPNPTITVYFRQSVNVTTDAAGRFSIYGALRSVTQAYQNAFPFTRAPEYAKLYDTYKPLMIKLYMTLQAPIIAATGRIGTAVDYDHTPPSSFTIDDLAASATYREHLARGVIDISFPLRKRIITEGEYTPNGADPSIALIHQGGYMDFATPVTTGTWFLAGDNLPATSRVGTLIITMKAKCRDSRTIQSIVNKRLQTDPNEQNPEIIGLSLPVNPDDPEDDAVLQKAIANKIVPSVGDVHQASDKQVDTQVIRTTKLVSRAIRSNNL